MEIILFQVELSRGFSAICCYQETYHASTPMPTKPSSNKRRQVHCEIRAWSSCEESEPINKETYRFKLWWKPVMHILDNLWWCQYSSYLCRRPWYGGLLIVIIDDKPDPWASRTPVRDYLIWPLNSTYTCSCCCAVHLSSCRPIVSRSELIRHSSLLFPIRRTHGPAIQHLILSSRIWMAAV